jgi:hypothetical protein
MKPQAIRRQVIWLTFLLAMASGAFASTWYVNGVTGSDDNSCTSPKQSCQTITNALNFRAVPGDSIAVAPATYTENLAIGFSVKILGSDQQNTIIDGGSLDTVIDVSNPNAVVTLARLTIQHGVATNGLGGGGIFNHGAKLTINDGTISGNKAGNYATPLSGGGIYNAGGTLLINKSTINGNLAISSGGGIFNSGGTVAINNSAVNGNFAGPTDEGSGGGIYSTGTLRLLNSTVNNNASLEIGGIYNNGTLIVSYSTISGNTSVDNVGGISSLGELTIGNSTISGNGSENNGPGGIAGDSVTIFNTSLYGNKSPGTPGGAIAARTLWIWNSTVANNGAIVSGGIAAGVATISNCTISGNFAFLEVGQAGGISINSGSIQNTIVANSTYGGNCRNSSTFKSKGYNISDDDTCNLNGPGDTSNTNPQLGPLQNNGGPTQTMAIASGSPAVDAGNPHGCSNGRGQLLTTDQRGDPRPDPGDVGVGCDIGAFELQDN